MKKLLRLRLWLLALMVLGGANFAAVQAEEHTDVLTADLFTATGTTYTDFSGVSVTGGSSAVYAGSSAKNSNGAIQLRSKNSNSGIVSTTSGGDRIKVLRLKFRVVLTLWMFMALILHIRQPQICIMLKLKEPK